MAERLRRLRRTPALRRLIRETTVEARSLVLPIFVSESATKPEPIPSMPGQFRWPLKELDSIVDEAEASDLGGLLFFGIPEHKDSEGTQAYAEDGIVAKAIAKVKAQKRSFVLAADVCLCEYTDHGHCGLLHDGTVDNDTTLPLLAQTAVVYAQAGADIVAPSSMMDYQELAIRSALDEANLDQIAVMSYSAKFSSAFYGPFRDAAGSAPQSGDRKAYQHDYANGRYAQRELNEAEDEGADILMVKPGLAYLDVLARARQETNLPLAVYNVSGEYAMVKAASGHGWIDEKSIVLETLTAFKRAGADIIITYHSIEASKWLKNS